MRVLRVTPRHPEPEAIGEAVAVLRAGGLVAFPTETVYGLGANALDAEAVRRIYVAKGRPDFNPLIVHVADAAGASHLARYWPKEAVALAEHFWPGPLTLVLPKDARVPDEVTAGLPAVALRVPAHPVAQALLTAAGLPIAAPSANRYTELSPTSAEHVVKSLGENVDLLLDGGPTMVGIESTVLDLTTQRPRLLRPGMVTVAELERVIGPVGAAPAVSGQSPRLAPGMVERHYAPRARLLLGSAADLHGVLDTLEGPVGALAFDDLMWPVAHPMRMPDDPASYASRLYAALHALDDLGCTVIVVEQPPDDAAWSGVRDRLFRAAEPPTLPFPDRRQGG